MVPKALSLVLVCCAVIGFRALRSCDDVARVLFKHSQAITEPVDEVGTLPLNTLKQDAPPRRNVRAAPNTTLIESGLNASSELLLQDTCTPEDVLQDQQHDTLTTGSTAGDSPLRTLLRSDSKAR